MLLLKQQIAPTLSAQPLKIDDLLTFSIDLQITIVILAETKLPFLTWS